MAEERQPNQITVFKSELTRMESQFAAALPAHIPLERFVRVLLTAVQNNPDLINKCSRGSLFNACIRAAQDGLLPDGREGAIVPYGNDAQWMPMIFGLRKKVRNSGELIDWDVQLVYENDQFEHQLGDGAYIKHRRAMGPRGGILGGYSIAHLKEGGVSREIMSIDEIESVRKQASRAKSDKSPWNIAAYYPEMCRKTIARRHSKNLPMSSDLDDLIRGDDDLYDLKGAKDERPARRTLTDALDQLAGPTQPKEGQPVKDETPKDETASDDQGTGEQRDNAAREEQEGREAQQLAHQDQVRNNEGSQKSTGETVDKKKPAATTTTATTTAKETKAPKPPKTEAEYVLYAKAWFESEPLETLRDRWKSKAEKDIRNGANVTPEKREELFETMTTEEDRRKAHK